MVHGPFVEGRNGYTEGRVLLCSLSIIPFIISHISCSLLLPSSFIQHSEGVDECNHKYQTYFRHISDKYSLEGS